MRTERPSVTVVTVTYNVGESLEKTIQSVLGQSYADVEYLIIDGNSTDETIEVIKKYEAELAYWISEPDDGIYDAMNKAIDQARGRWINFMNAGDTFAHKETIEEMLKDLEEDTDLYCGGIDFVDPSTLMSHYRAAHGLQSIWKTIPCWHQATFIRTALMKEYKYATEYKIAADHEFFIRCHVNKKRFQFIDRAVATMMGGGLHQQELTRAHVESMKVLVDYLPDIDMLFSSVYPDELCRSRPSLSSLEFSKGFNLFYDEIKEIQREYQKIALYGYGAVGKTVSALLGDKVCVIIDQDKRLQDAKASPPVCTAEELGDYDFEILVITVLGREEEIASTLGIDEEKVFRIALDGRDSIDQSSKGRRGHES